MTHSEFQKVRVGDTVRTERGIMTVKETYSGQWAECESKDGKWGIFWFPFVKTEK
jgi:hypothetical protein